MTLTDSDQSFLSNAGPDPDPASQNNSDPWVSGSASLGTGIDKFAFLFILSFLSSRIYRSEYRIV